MKKTKKILCLLLCVMLVCMTLAGSLTAMAVDASVEVQGTGYVDLGNVIQLTEYSDGVLHLIYYPKWMETSQVQMPILVFANGTGCAPVLYISFLMQMAEQGFVVVESSNIMSGDGQNQIACLDYILTKNTDPSSVFCGKLDAGRVGTFGHSQGGRGSVNAAINDPRFKAVIYIAGSSFVWETQNLTTPTLFLSARTDFFVFSPVWVRPNYEVCSAPAVYANMIGGYHTKVFLKPSTYNYYCTEWFKAWLNGDQEALNRFRPGGQMSQDPGWEDFASKNF